MENRLFNVNYCQQCTLKGNFKVLGEGNLNSEIMIIGEAPGETEVTLKRPFVGRSGQLLTETLKKVGIDRSMCYITNAVLCHPLQNRTPTKEEINNCRERLVRTITKVQPKIIISLGGCALYSILKKNVSIEKMRGKVVHSDEFKCGVIFTYHPAAVLRDPYKYKPFYEDLSLVSKVLNESYKSHIDEKNYIVLDDISKVMCLFNDIVKEKEVAIDIETTGLDPWKDKIVSIAFSYRKGEAFWLPTYFYERKKFWNELEWKDIVDAMKEIFNKGDIKFIVHNESFEYKFLKVQLDIELNSYFDTLLAHHLLDENSSHVLKILAVRYSDVFGYNDNIIYENIHQLPVDLLSKYNCTDADVTYRLYKEFEEDLKKEELTDLFYNVVMPVRKVLTKMELKGVKIDEKYLNKLEVNWKDKIKQIEEEIYTKVGKELNLNSTQQLSKLLFNDLGFDVVKKTSKGNISVDNEVISKLSEKSDVAKLVVMYRKLQKLLTTYVIGMRRKINTVTNLIHTEYLMHGTVSGRVSSRNPNLQNIPRGEDEYSSDIKKCFIPREAGWRIIEFDYKQLEYRVLLAYVKDKKMIENIENGLDIHKYVASEIFKKKLDDVTDKERSIAKTIVFGLIYGMGRKTLAKELNLSDEEADDIMKRFFSMHKSIKKWMDYVIAQLRDKKYVKSLLNRRRRLLSIDSIDENIIVRTERQAVNFPVQSLAADLTFVALVKIYNRFKELNLKAFPIIIVHDSIVVEAPENEVDVVVSEVKNIMKCPLGSNFVLGNYVPLDVDVKVGERWGE